MVTKPYQYPQENIASTTGGPDFPGSAGDRERGKFRPSATPRRTVVAVAGDDGQPVVRNTDALLAELVLWHKAVAVGLVLQSEGVKFSVNDLLNEAGRL